MTKKLYFVFAASTIVCSVFILLLRFDVQIPLSLKATKEGTFEPKKLPPWTPLGKRRSMKLTAPETAARDCDVVTNSPGLTVECTPAIRATNFEATVTISDCSLFDVLVTKFE